MQPTWSRCPSPSYQLLRGARGPLVLLCCRRGRRDDDDDGEDQQDQERGPPHLNSPSEAISVSLSFGAPEVRSDGFPPQSELIKGLSDRNSAELQSQGLFRISAASV